MKTQRPAAAPAPSPTNASTPARRHRGNNGIRQHPKPAKALALADPSHTRDAANIAGIPVRTVRYWIEHFESWEDSELEAFIAAAKRRMAGAWAVLGQEGQEFALELRNEGRAKDFLSAMTGAGIADTKLEKLGQPRTIEMSPGSDSPSMLRNVPGLAPPDEPANSTE